MRKVGLANPVCLPAASYLKTAKMVVDVTLLGAQHKGKFTSTGGPSVSEWDILVNCDINIPE